MVTLAISTSQFQSQVADLLPCNKSSKSQLILGLLNAYKLLDQFDHIITDPFSSEEEMLQFHDKKYVETLLNVSLNQSTWKSPDETLEQWKHLAQLVKNDASATQHAFQSPKDLLDHYKTYTNEGKMIRKRSIMNTDFEDQSEEEKGCEEVGSSLLKEFNLEGDCPIFPYLPLYLKVITGATLRLLDIPGLNLKPLNANTRNDRFIGINWDGGRHHAMKRKASGFCYINDIVLLLQKIRKKGIQKITYLDFDLHHGDGVEKAMLYSKNVQTISLHLYEVGFFPCTGSLNESKGINTVTLPLLHGFDDECLNKLTDHVIQPCIRKFKPEVIVIQCGSDGLMGDTFHEWQLSIVGLTNNIIKVMKQFPQCHVILLGGGGYNPTLTSRFYAYLTWSILNECGGLTKRLEKNPFEEEHSQDPKYDVLIPDHLFGEFYGDEEHYKFWSYDQDGSPLYRPLKNDNKPCLISNFRAHYQLD